MERTTLTLVQSLPGISRWFEVEKRELVSEDTKLQNTPISHNGCYSTFLFFRMQFRAPANTQVLIQVITLKNNNGLGHGFGAIGHISFPPLNRLDVVLKIRLLCFDYQHFQLVWNGFFHWEFFPIFYHYCFQPGITIMFQSIPTLCYT